MGHSKVISTAAMGLAAIFTASQANAMQAGTCIPAAQANSELKSEGQRSLIIADRVNISGTGKSQIITSNADGHGYILEGNKPVGQASTEFCVAVKFDQAQLRDIRGAAPANDAPQMMFQARTLVGQNAGPRVSLYFSAKAGLGGIDMERSASQSVRMATVQNAQYTGTALELLNRPVLTASVK